MRISRHRIEDYSAIVAFQVAPKKCGGVEKQRHRPRISETS